MSGALVDAEPPPPILAPTNTAAIHGGRSPAGRDRPPTAFALHIPSLDGIRALSFFVVFAAHAGLQNVIPGGFGVTVFFFLSGYLITTLLRVEWIHFGTVSLKQFYLRRALRILPPFYIVLGLATLGAAIGLVPGGFRPAAAVAQFLHVANYWIVNRGYAGQPAGTGVYWSLAVEEHFYLLFPLIFIALRIWVKAPAREAAALYALCLSVLVWRCVLVYGAHSIADRTYVASDTRVDSILYGCALAVYGNPALDGPSRISAATWKWVLLPVGLALLMFTFIHRDPGFRETLRYSLQGVALTPIFAAAIRYPSWGFFRVLNWRSLRFVGLLSYSLYLVHHVILEVVDAHVAAPRVARVALSLALALALSWVMYRVVERPCARLRKRLSRGADIPVAPKPRPTIDGAAGIESGESPERAEVQP